MVSLFLAAALAAGIGQTQTGNQTGGSAASPQNPQAAPAPISQEMRGDIFMARKMYREAIETYAEIAGKNPVIWNKTGIAYHQMGQLDKAKKSYERALKLRPQYAEAQNNVGTIYYATKSYRRAISAYKKALRITPDSASFHMNLGTAYMARKMEKEAIAEYQIALKLDPEAGLSHSTYGTTLETQGAEDKARLHYAMAKAYASQNMTELALQFLRRSLEEGFKDRKKLERDPEFDAMRETPEFKELMALEPRVL
jgi:tetratricopeptide (TPR) repeat protein